MTQDIYLIRIITCILFLKCNILFGTKMQQNSIKNIASIFQISKDSNKANIVHVWYSNLQSSSWLAWLWQ